MNLYINIKNVNPFNISRVQDKNDVNNDMISKRLKTVYKNQNLNYNISSSKSQVFMNMLINNAPSHHPLGEPAGQIIEFM